MIEGRIDTRGNFRVTKLRDRGHPEAGQYLKRVLQTWSFVPYKQGVIKYYFNLPTRLENMKIQIDLRRLEKNFDYIGPNDVLKNGMLCFVEGISGKSIMLRN